MLEWVVTLLLWSLLLQVSKDLNLGINQHKGINVGLDGSTILGCLQMVCRMISSVLSGLLLLWSVSLFFSGRVVYFSCRCFVWGFGGDFQLSLFCLGFW